MASYSQETRDITVDVVILPGFSEGLSRRGAWFAHTMDANSFVRKFLPNRGHVVRYVVYEPTSSVPLSDAEIDHLINKITSAQDQYRSELERLELSYKDTRRDGKLNALLYILGILTIRWYWWIFITRGEASFNNQQNALMGEYAANTRNFFTRFWERGRDPVMRGVLDEIVALYRELDVDPLRKYMILRNHASKQAMLSQLNGDRLKAGAYRRVEQGYREIIKKSTGRSLIVKILPTNFWQRISHFFLQTFKVPEPESVYPVRDLSKDISAGLTRDDILIKDSKILGGNRADGNIFELYLLATKRGDPICVPAKDAFYLSEALARAETIRERDLPMEMLLHVGTERERRALLGFNAADSIDREKQRLIHKRLQNAALDTTRQGEAIISYYLREIVSVYYRQYQMMYPFRSRLHSLFPWLFILHGIPVASALAAVWLFVDPYYQGKIQGQYRNYFSKMLEGVNWAYHNVVIHVKRNPALGYINQKILRNEDGKAYRDIIRDINECALPVSLMDRAILNDLTTETPQLRDFQREANDFTTIPLSFYRGDGEREGEDMVKNFAKIGDVIGGVYEA
ncbi:MAG: hypothetical protein ACUVXI_16705 [bacterium]